MRKIGLLILTTSC